MVRFASLIRAGVSAVRVHGGRCILPPSSRQLLPVAQRRSLFGVPEEVMPEPERRVEKVDFCVIGGGPAGWAAAAVGPCRCETCLIMTVSSSEHRVQLI